MIVLKTIPEIPAVPAVIDNVYQVTDLQINFVEKMVSFTVKSVNTYGALANIQQAPLSRKVHFDEIATKLVAGDVPGFVNVIRNSLALSMGVTLDKIPADIFAQ
jgi:N12 class adenine-specific DNA methylase